MNLVLFEYKYGWPTCLDEAFECHGYFAHDLYRYRILLNLGKVDKNLSQNQVVYVI